MSSGAHAAHTPEQEGWTPAQWTGAVVAWLWVAAPFVWGLYELLIKIPALFR